VRFNTIASLLLTSIKEGLFNYFSPSKVFYISDRADWVIKDIGNALFNYLPDHQIKVTNVYFGIRNSIVHYGSITSFLTSKKIKSPHKSNKIIVSWFHVLDGDKRADLIYKVIPIVDIWHTASHLTKQKLIQIGIPIERIMVIPLGIDTAEFMPVSREIKNNYRKKFRVPDDAIVIGSFQKDGSGWGEGLEPKLEKGPDIFCDIVEQLSKKFNIYVLLTGPSRGYVKKRLEFAQIPFHHDFLDNPISITKYFQSIDLYLVCSREEGGPKAILESLACGVPLVSTRVGMASDVITHGENGFLADIEDLDELFILSKKIIDSPLLAEKFSLNGVSSIQKYNWKIISNNYAKYLYS